MVALGFGVHVAQPFFTKGQPLEPCLPRVLIHKYCLSS